MKHGFDSRNGKDRFYRIWDAMKARSTNFNSQSADNYLKRGISICNEWLNFANFKKDMYESYQDHIRDYGEKNTTIDRKNNDCGYSANNCRWATRKEQSRNLRTNRIIEFKGELHCLSEWGEITGINKKILSYRINSGWSIERALTTQINQNMGRYKRNAN